MSSQESKNPLEDKPFSFRQYKNGKISISWNNKEVMVLKGIKAKTFAEKMANSTVNEGQLLMAKITGNFKRGNENEGKLREK